jgi:hypothetical protein
MSVWFAEFERWMKSCTRCANARFWALAVLGRSSNVVFAMMSFSLKLPVSMRATANVSAGSSRERV